MYIMTMNGNYPHLATLKGPTSYATVLKMGSVTLSNPTAIAATDVNGNIGFFDITTYTGSGGTYDALAPCTPVECSEPRYLLCTHLISTTNYYLIGYKNGLVFSFSNVGKTSPITKITTFLSHTNRIIRILYITTGTVRIMVADRSGLIRIS